MRKIGILLAGLLFGSSAWGQIEWLEKDYEFGLMKELAGPKTGVSRFVNRGKAPVTITYARPSCGCTSVEYTETPIEQGDTATIRFTYDPTGRPGRFEKSIKLTFNDEWKDLIRISGNVLGTPESLAVFYPVEVGPLRLTEDGINAGTITMGGLPTKFINGYNQTGDTIRPVARSGAPALKVTTSTEAAGPGDIVTFGIYFDSRAHGVAGPVEIPIEILSNGEGSESHEVLFRTEVLPDRRPGIERNPGKNGVCFIAPTTVDLGIIPAGNKREFSFRIMNQGRGALQVSRVYGDSEAISLREAPKRLKGGKSGEAELTLDAGLLPAGPFRMIVTVITSDGNLPVQKVAVCGVVE